MSHVQRPLLVAALLTSSAASAAPIFTGNVPADFTGAEVIVLDDGDTPDVGMPIAFPAGTTSGWDFRRLYIDYDADADVLSVGFETYGVMGDADGDGDPDAASPTLAGLGGTDAVAFGPTESIAVYLDLDEDGLADLIAGIPALGDASSVGAYAIGGSLGAPGLAFGAPLPQHTGEAFTATSLATPHFEIRIVDFSLIPLSSGGDAVSTFGVGFFAGSLSDAGIGEDFYPGVLQFTTVRFPECGDGFVDADEECDDGNDADDDLCRSDCTLPVCGDGVVQPGEQCDDGNGVDTDGCTNACSLASCGDGIVGPGEECDPGTIGGDTGDTDAGGEPYDLCTPECTLPRCGDGYLQPDEECDDGNTLDDDGCSASCLIEFCGDGVIQPGEQCDDGNTTAGDGCSPDCSIEVVGGGCTYTIGWYKNHNPLSTKRNQRVEWPLPHTTELCGKTWLEWLWTQPRGSAWTILAHQWIGATLNTAGGASSTPEVDAALAAGADLLSSCSVAPANRSTAISLATTLDAYNNGWVGPGHCD